MTLGSVGLEVLGAELQKYSYGEPESYKVRTEHDVVLDLKEWTTAAPFWSNNGVRCSVLGQTYRHALESLVRIPIGAPCVLRVAVKNLRLIGDIVLFRLVFTVDDGLVRTPTILGHSGVGFI